STLGLIPKPELGIQFGSGETCTRLLMIESEGITANVPREQ
ncbi:680_t:CDS:2, partial [Funneliformis mosseae]